MKEISEEKKQVLAAVDAGIKKLHTLDESITLYEVSRPSAVNCLILCSETRYFQNEDN